MARYIVLSKLTDQGRRNIKDMPKRNRERQRRAAEAGFTSATYFTPGEYDLISIVDGIDEEAAMARVLEGGMHGYVQMKAVRAYTVDEMEQIIAKMPE